MKPEHLQYIVCPICKNKFKVLNKKYSRGEIKSATLVCEKYVGHYFQIKEFIPRILFSPTKTSRKHLTEKAFEDKWLNNKNYMKKMAKFQEKWYLKRYGFNKKTFKQFMKKKEFILEAGCGVGKDTAFFAKNTKGIVFVVDISSSIDTARKNNNFDNVCFIQADITILPFKDSFFDFVSCDQVIHHTPHPNVTLKHLVKKTKHFGNLAIYVYKKKGIVREFCDDFIRKKGTFLSYNECYKFCEPITKLGKELSKIKQKIKVPDIPILGIKKGSYDLQRFIYYNILKCFWNDDFDFHINNVVNVDWYNPKLASRHTVEEVKSWCEKLNLSIIHLDEEEQSGISWLVEK